MVMRVFVVVVFFLGLVALTKGQAQSDTTSLDPEDILNHAAEEFSAGHFVEIPDILDHSVMSKFTREQEQRAHLLLVETYLIEDDPARAKKNYLQVLKVNPEFETDEHYDPIDLVYLSKKFTAAPIFSLFGSLGVNTEPVRVIYPIEQGEHETKTYLKQAGFDVNGGIDWNISKHVALSAEAGYSYTSFLVRGSGLFPSNYTIPFADNVELEEHEHWLDLPLTLKYMDAGGKFRPYGYVGYAVHFLFADQGSLSIADNNPGLETLDKPSSVDSKGLPQSILSIRNSLNRSLIVGGGLRIKWKLNYVFADVRYSVGQSMVSNKKYLDPGVFQYAYADDYFRVDRMTFTAGYLLPLYKPRELKKARTKSVLRRIEKK